MSGTTRIGTRVAAERRRLRCRSSSECRCIAASSRRRVVTLLPPGIQPRLAVAHPSNRLPRAGDDGFPGVCPFKNSRAPRCSLFPASSALHSLRCFHPPTSINRLHPELIENDYRNGRRHPPDHDGPGVARFCGDSAVARAPFTLPFDFSFGVGQTLHVSNKVATSDTYCQTIRGHA